MSNGDLPPRGREHSPWADAAWVVGLLLVTTAAGLLLQGQLSLASLCLIYVLAVVVASYRLRMGAAIACAVLSVLLLNYFFIEPLFAFRVNAPENAVALAALLAVSLVISHRGAALRREAQAARIGEARARRLQELAVDLAAAGTSDEIRVAGERALDAAFAGRSRIVLATDPPLSELPDEAVAPHRGALLACLADGAALGPGTGRRPELPAWYLPLRSERQVEGAAQVPPPAGADAPALQHAQAICTLLAQALSRLRLASSVRSAEENSRWHRAQSTFLAGISHDFRTPLAAVVTAASSLQSQRHKLSDAELERLVQVILGEAAHLNTLTENTLNLARLQNASELHLDWQSMEEIAGSVLARIRRRDPERRIHSRVPPQLPLVQADPVLLAQLLENLLDNALKYSAGPIDLVASHAGAWLEVAVQDRGDGIPPADAEAIFEPYRRIRRNDQRGAGLGLAVCRAIARAHGGDLQLAPREGGGSVFTLQLPVERDQPVLDPT